MQKGGFELQKWCSNAKELLTNIPLDKREQKMELSEDQSVKALG
jgi:hypothetical protein